MQQKTKETTCSKCGGEAELSQAYVHIDLYEKDANELGARAIYKGVGKAELRDCLKCIKCDHSWVPISTDRQLAMEWWNNLDWQRQDGLAKKYIGGTRPSQISLNAVKATGREIEAIWKAEKGDSLKQALERIAEESIPKKQFTKFNPKLFEAYINKFSDEDKLNALIVLFKNCEKEAPITLVKAMLAYTAK